MRSEGRTHCQRLEHVLEVRVQSICSDHLGACDASEVCGQDAVLPHELHWPPIMADLSLTAKQLSHQQCHRTDCIIIHSLYLTSSMEYAAGFMNVMSIVGYSKSSCWWIELLLDCLVIARACTSLICW